MGGETQPGRFLFERETRPQEHMHMHAHCGARPLDLPLRRPCPPWGSPPLAHPAAPPAPPFTSRPPSLPPSPRFVELLRRFPETFVIEGTGPSGRVSLSPSLDTPAARSERVAAVLEVGRQGRGCHPAVALRAMRCNVMRCNAMAWLVASTCLQTTAGWRPLARPARAWRTGGGTGSQHSSWHGCVQVLYSVHTCMHVCICLVSSKTSVPPCWLTARLKAPAAAAPLPSAP